MHPLMLDISAAILLLSSIISCGLLLKRTPKLRLTSITSILSVSDMTNSFLTAFLIFFYQFHANQDDYFRRQAHAESDSRFIYETKVWAKNSHSGNQTDFKEDYSNEHCNLKSAFLQYALFFIPFAHAFISLLSFSLNFYASTVHINRRCFQWMKALKEPSKYKINERECVVEASEGDSAQRESEVKKESIREIIRKFKLPTNYTGFAIASQWLIPTIFGGAIQFGGYQNVRILNRSTEDLVCAYTATFPFDNCIKENLSVKDISSTDIVASSLSLYNYVSSEDNLLWPNPNSSEVNDVLSKIQHIIKSAVNTPILEDEIENTGDYYNITQLLDIANSINQSLIENRNLINGNELEPKNRLFRRIAQGNYDFNKNKSDSSTIGSSTNEENIEFNKVSIYQCMKNRCIIPAKLLKIYFFLILTLIYFAPIFISTLLLVISYYKCFEIKEKLVYCRVENDSKKSNGLTQDSPLERFTEIDNENDEILNGNHEKQGNELCLKFEKMVYDLSCEIDKLWNFIKIFKINILGAIAFWTPLFFEILLKVFFCSNVPNWLMEMTFLATIVFAVLRNAVNLNVLKLDLDKKKPNTVHPN